jgi:hypothetical protein
MVWNGAFPIDNVREGAVHTTVGFGFAPNTSEGGFVWFESHDLVYHEGCSAYDSQPGTVLSKVVGGWHALQLPDWSFGAIFHDSWDESEAEGG